MGILNKPRNTHMADTMTGVDIFPPRPERDELAASAELDRIEALATMLDSWVAIPGTDVRIGLDPLVGLLPGVGDVIMLVASLYVVDRLSRLGLSRWARLRMIGNVLIDSAIGAIPVLGDIFDVAFKANVANVALARRELGL
jgi:hypothetical protein